MRLAVLVMACVALVNVAATAAPLVDQAVRARPAASAAISASTLGLQQAAQANRTDDALRFLSRGADADARDATGRSPLNWAALFGNDRLAAALLAKGAAVNRTVQGATLLHDAVTWPVVEDSGKAPVARPSLRGKRLIVDRLLRLQLDPNAVDVNGSTALHLAVGLPSGSPDPAAIVRALLAKGANPSARNGHGLTPIDLARRRGDLGLLAALSRG